MSIDPYSYVKDSKRRLEFNKIAHDFLETFFDKNKGEVEKAWDNFDSDIELRRFIGALRFWDRLTEHELKPEATTLTVLVMLSTIEGFVPLERNNERITNFFENYFSPEDQIKLLASFTFSKPYRLGESQTKQPPRHLMYKRAPKNGYDASEYGCSTGDDAASLCSCVNWLRKQEEVTQRQYTATLARRLYGMRNSVVHDAKYVQFVHTEKQPSDVAFWGMTLVDIYSFGRTPGKEPNHVVYETGLSKDELATLFKAALWRYFQSPSVVDL
jgi:hypothetical protein